jgi:ABC-type transport system involved in multi-copper enzyme maturation permease subunit
MSLRSLRTDWGQRWHAAALIQWRDLRAMILGRGIYLILSLALLAAIVILRNSLNFIDENGLLVASGAFTLPLFAVILVSALFLALSSVTTIARERDQGTLEALFYGPVDSVAYVLGKYLAQVGTYLVMVAIYVGSFLIYAGLTNFIFPASLGWVILLSILIVSNLIALGIFLSTLVGTVRTALLLFLGLVVVFLVIEAGHEVLAALPVQGGYYNPLLFLQNALALLNQGVDWLSPLAYLNQGMEAVRRESYIAYLAILLISALYTFIFLGLSVITLERKGVRK